MGLTEFLANLTTGAATVISVVGDVGETFMDPPFVILPICAISILGYKVGLKVINKIKKA